MDGKERRAKTRSKRVQPKPPGQGEDQKGARHVEQPVGKMKAVPSPGRRKTPETGIKAIRKNHQRTVKPLIRPTRRVGRDESGFHVGLPVNKRIPRHVRRVVVNEAVPPRGHHGREREERDEGGRGEILEAHVWESIGKFGIKPLPFGRARRSVPLH